MERSGHAAAPPFGSTGAVYSREVLAAPWHVLILQVCVCALGCPYNCSKMLNLSLLVSDLTPTAVCWQMLTPNA